jgi:hypothetical protein
MICQTWEAKSCSSGHELALCLHAGGHVFNPEWLREAYSWVVALNLARTALPSEPATQNEHGP